MIDEDEEKVDLITWKLPGSGNENLTFPSYHRAQEHIPLPYNLKPSSAISHHTTIMHLSLRAAILLLPLLLPYAQSADEHTSNGGRRLHQQTGSNNKKRLASVNAAHQDNEPSSLLRGTNNKQKQQAAHQPTAAELFPIYDPLQDFARTGLDRSLSYIHDSELNLPLSTEVMDSISEYITKYSVDGNDDNTDVSVFEYDEDQESSYGGGRALQDQDGHTVADHGGHSEHDYIVSTCNAHVDTATCVNWSEYFDHSSVVGVGINSTLEPPADYLESEVKIPCGVCVTLDASPGDDLYGSTLEFAQGLNIVGKLIIPNDAKVHLRTKYVYVQGVLSMPEPPPGSSNGIPSDVDGDRVEITLYGKDDLMFKADEMTDNDHHSEKGVNNKAIVIAGGKSCYVVYLLFICL